MDVLPLSPTSEASLLDAWHHLDRTAYDDVLAGVEPPTRDESVMDLDGGIDADRWGLLATSDGVPVAGYVACEPLLEDTDIAEGWLVVDPRHRGAGHAQRLLEHVRERHVAAGRKRLATAVRVDTPGARLAASLGARAVQVELCNVLDVAHAPAELGDLATSVPPGYWVQTWLDVCPDELVTSYAAAHDAMNDVPYGDERHDDWSWTSERVRAVEARHQRHGIRCVTTVAVHEETGEVAGYTDVLVTGRRSTVVQEDTGVVRRHRGHGLGLLVKSVNLTQSRELWPSTRHVVTWNAERNTHMLAVNHRLGFRRHSRWQETMLDL